MNRAALAGLLLCVSGCPDPPASPTLEAKRPVAEIGIACLDDLPPLPAGLEPVGKALCSEFRGQDHIGASVALAVDGEIVWRAQVGERCRGRPAKVDSKTLFRAGSITKMFTSAAAYTQHRAGRIDLDAPIAGHDFTLAQLLGHTAGLPERLPVASESLEDARKEWTNAPRLAAPDTVWNYANPGFYIAGETVPPSAVKTDVLIALGTNEATFDQSTGAAACGHLDDGSEPLSVADDFSRFAFGAKYTIPAGGLLATPSDLVSFALASSAEDGPLAGFAQEVVRRAQPTREHPDEQYALGVRVRSLPGGKTLLLHHGFSGDFAADLYWLPEDRFAIATMTNRGRHLRATVFAALRSGAAVDVALRPAPPGELRAYVGEYRSASLSAPVSVRLADGLTIDAPDLGLRAAPLEHRQHHVFAATPGGPTFVFLALDDTPPAIDAVRTARMLAKR